ncbi:MAG: hypothetical protein U0T81_04510 [Saprospiraceae bacterium]
MIKSVILLLLEFLLYGVGMTQNTWQRSESSSQLEVGTVAISSANEYFISLKNNHHIFYSRDSGATWQEVEVNNGVKKFYKSIDRAYLKAIKDKVYCVSCAGSAKRYIYNGEFFNILPNYTNIPYENLFLSQEGKVFYKDELCIARTDSNWNRIINTFLFSTSFPYGFLATNFYTEDNNYIITQNNKDSLFIYKLKTDQSGAVSPYSKFKVSRSVSTALVSKGGTIYFMDNGGSNRVFNYVLKTEQNKIQKSSLQLVQKVNVVYYYYVNEGAEIYLVTDKGVFMNNGIDEDVWIKCHQMSDNIPLPPSFNVLAWDTRYFIKDSLNAMISYGDNCGQSDYYCFTPKFKKWRTIQLDVHIDNLNDLVKDRNNRLYAFRPCENYFGMNYLQSDNNGKDWEYVLINGEYATSIGINKSGEAMAIAANNRLYRHNTTVDNWEEIQLPLDTSGKIKLLHIYSSGNDLFLTGNIFINYAKEYNYLYHSMDGGLHWTEIKSFVQQTAVRGNDFTILKDNNGNWIAYSDQGRLTPDGILISKDKGKTWEIDNRFKDFSAFSLLQLPDNRFLLSGTINYSNPGTYLIDSLGNYSNYSSNYVKNPASLYLDKDSLMFGYINYNYNPIPFYSFDLGLNVFNNESGLNPTDKETCPTCSAIYESRDKITLNLAYDGIYTTTHDIFSNITDELNLKEKYSFHKVRIGFVLKRKTIRPNQVKNFRRLIYWDRYFWKARSAIYEWNDRHQITCTRHWLFCK